MSVRLPPAVMIDTQARLIALAYLLADEPIIAVDTESNSMHAYVERICLIQISTCSADYIIDPLKIHDMSPLLPVFENARIQKVFHAAEYDLMCLRRDFNIVVNNLFDTMVGGRICGYKLIGLNNLLSHHLGVEIDKSHQRDNWGERPLPADSLLYAQMDTHYLITLRDILYDELEKRGHLEEALEAFKEVAEDILPPETRNFDPDGFWNIGIPNRLNPTQMAILREVYLLRERIAEECNKPPYRIMSTNALLLIAQQAPTSMKRLSEMHELHHSTMRHYGDAILEAVKRGRDVQLPEPPQRRQPPAQVSDLYMVLHAWRKDRAIHRGVESDVIVPKHTLWSLAYKMPANLDEMQNIRGLGPWRLRQYGEELLDLIQNFQVKFGETTESNSSD